MRENTDRLESRIFNNPEMIAKGYDGVFMPMVLSTSLSISDGTNIFDS